MNFYGMIIIYQIKKKDTIILLNSLGDLLIYACIMVVTVSGFKMIYEGQCFFLSLKNINCTKELGKYKKMFLWVFFFLTSILCTTGKFNTKLVMIK
jgi:hypothetical protein